MIEAAHDRPPSSLEETLEDSLRQRPLATVVLALGKSDSGSRDLRRLYAKKQRKLSGLNRILLHWGAGWAACPF